jgi:ribosomal protein L37AE/L43A
MQAKYERRYFVNNAKDAVLNYARRIEELENEQVKAKSELISNLKESNNLKATEFIDWYYWETDYSTDILCDVIGINKATLTKMITKPHAVPYPCPKCKGTNYHPCKNRSEANLLFSPSHLKFNKDKYICQKCKDDETKRKEEKSRKAAAANREKNKKRISLLQSMPYEEYLLTPHWKKFSQERRREADYECEKCKRDDLKLHVHHLTYERRGHEKPSDVIVLCEACHLAIHGRPIPAYMIKNPVPLMERALKAMGKTL